jgi:hypothetical protein
MFTSLSRMLLRAGVQTGIITGCKLACFNHQDVAADTLTDLLDHGSRVLRHTMQRTRRHGPITTAGLVEQRRHFEPMNCELHPASNPGALSMHISRTTVRARGHGQTLDKT